MESFSFLNEVESWKRRTPSPRIALLTSLASIPEPGRHEFGDALILRRAEREEAIAFRKVIEALHPLCLRNPYEVVLEPSATVGTLEHVALPENAWRYHVIEYTVTGNQALQNLVWASCLTPTELEVGFEAFVSGGTCGFSPFPALQRLVSPGIGAELSVVLDRNALQELREVADKLSRHDAEKIQLVDALGQYVSLRDLPPLLPLRYLGYFAVIESLITHAPKPSDPYDSITRQVTKKFAALNHRAAHPLDHDRFFGGTNPEKIWKLLYGYRSTIAHGSRPDFSRDHKPLKSATNALEYLRRATTLVMRQALEEPTLVADLRDC